MVGGRGWVGCIYGYVIREQKKPLRYIATWELRDPLVLCAAESNRINRNKVKLKRKLFHIPSLTCYKKKYPMRVRGSHMSIVDVCPLHTHFGGTITLLGEKSHRCCSHVSAARTKAPASMRAKKTSHSQWALSTLSGGKTLIM